MYPPCVYTCKHDEYGMCMWVWSCALLHVSHSGCQACTAVAQTARSSPLCHLPSFKLSYLTPKERNTPYIMFPSHGKHSFGCLALDAKKNKSKAQSNEWVGCNKPPSLSKPGFRYQSSIFGHCGHHNTSLVTASASDTSSVLSWRTCVC